MARADCYYADRDGATAFEGEEGESLHQQPTEGRPDRRAGDGGVSSEDDAGPDDDGQLIGEPRTSTARPLRRRTPRCP